MAAEPQRLPLRIPTAAEIERVRADNPRVANLPAERIRELLMYRLRRQRSEAVLPDALQLLRAATAPFGNLSRFSPEIRCMIYNECVVNRSIGLLRASKQFHNEFIPLLLERFVLSFHVDPSASSSVVKILNQNGETLDVASPHLNYSSILEKMPVDHFRRIEISINAPDPADPGQLVRAWRQTTGLLTALLPRWKSSESLLSRSDIELPQGRKTVRLPPLIVKLPETRVNQWTSPSSRSERVRTLNHSVPTYRDWDPVSKRVLAIVANDPHSDIEIIVSILIP